MIIASGTDSSREKSTSMEMGRAAGLENPPRPWDGAKGTMANERASAPVASGVRWTPDWR
jgi:hypothetical protein